MNKKTDIISWVNIPKINISNFSKKEDVTESILKASTLTKSKALLILEAIERSGEKRIQENQPPVTYGNLYNLVANKDLLRLAYQKLSKNKGAMTPGVSGSTADSTSEHLIQKISESLMNHTFK
jgi:retron-type reverse transcriptase